MKVNFRSTIILLVMLLTSCKTPAKRSVLQQSTSSQDLAALLLNTKATELHFFNANGPEVWTLEYGSFEAMVSAALAIDTILPGSMPTAAATEDPATFVKATGLVAHIDTLLTSTLPSLDTAELQTFRARPEVAPVYDAIVAVAESLDRLGPTDAATFDTGKLRDLIAEYDRTSDLVITNPRTKMMNPQRHLFAVSNGEGVINATPAHKVMIYDLLSLIDSERQVAQLGSSPLEIAHADMFMHLFQMKQAAISLGGRRQVGALLETLFREKSFLYEYTDLLRQLDHQPYKVRLRVAGPRVFREYLLQLQALNDPSRDLLFYPERTMPQDAGVPAEQRERSQVPIYTVPLSSTAGDSFAYITTDGSEPRPDEKAAMVNVLSEFHDKLMHFRTQSDRAVLGRFTAFVERAMVDLDNQRSVKITASTFRPASAVTEPSEERLETTGDRSEPAKSQEASADQGDAPREADAKPAAKPSGARR